MTKQQGEYELLRGSSKHLQRDKDSTTHEGYMKG
jgi:hypothetical protein